MVIKEELVIEETTITNKYVKEGKIRKKEHLILEKHIIYNIIMMN